MFDAVIHLVDDRRHRIDQRPSSRYADVVREPRRDARHGTLEDCRHRALVILTVRAFDDGRQITCDVPGKPQAWREVVRAVDVSKTRIVAADEVGTDTRIDGETVPALP